MRSILYLSICLSLFSCSTQEAEKNIQKDQTTVPKVAPEVVDKANLVEIIGDVYTEYYAGKKQIKFQGTQDEEGKRHGKWLFFSESGDELSMTMYAHGKKHGHSIVKYPNGALHYVGEYKNDKQVGEWKTYTVEGKLHEAKDFGYPEN